MVCSGLGSRWPSQALHGGLAAIGAVGSRARGGWYNSAIDLRYLAEPKGPITWLITLKASAPSSRRSVPRAYAPYPYGDYMKRDPMIEDIMRKAKRNGVKVIQVPRDELDQKSARGSHQGVMAEAAPFNYVGIGQVVDAANSYAEEHDGRALVVLCDHLTDAGNLGAISRSCEAVGASGLIIPNKRSARVEASTYKSSAGAITHVPVAQVSNIVQSIHRLQEEGFWVCAANRAHRRPGVECEPEGQDCHRLGQRARRRVRLCLEHCDMYAKLPLEGEVARPECGAGRHRRHVRVAAPEHPHRLTAAGPVRRCGALSHPAFGFSCTSMAQRPMPACFSRIRGTRVPLTDF